MLPLKDNIPTDRLPVVTIALILANVVVYLLTIRHGGSLIGGPDTQEVVRYGAIPYALTHPGQHCGLLQTYAGQAVACSRSPLSGAVTTSAPAWETVFTSMFMHGSIVHIGGNMLFLWIFGNNVEDAMGRVRFVAFYLLGGIAALALQVALNSSAAVPTIGASGAIAAVLGGYIVLYPRARVLTLLFIVVLVTVIELPAIVVLGIWFAEQAVFSATNLTDPTGGGGGVAYFAHIGGFIFGLATIRLVATRRREIPPRLPVY